MRFVFRKLEGILMAVILHRCSTAVMTISTEDRDFVETLGVSQQTVQAYEMGMRRIPVSALPIVAHMLAVPLDELFGETNHTANKRGRTSRLQQQIKAIRAPLKIRHSREGGNPAC